MTGNEPGWYRDPAPPNPGQPTTLRYWDGSGWTAQVKHASRAQREQWVREDNEQWYARAVAAAEAGAAPGAVAPAGATLVTQHARGWTPDGQVLSGWWRRVFASVIDSVIVGVAGVVFAWPWVSEIGRAYQQYLTAVLDSTRRGLPVPSPDAFMASIDEPLLYTALIAVLVQLVYGVGFLKALSATPGKLVLGIEVRLLERPGVLSWRTVLVRWFAQNPSIVVRLIPAGVWFLLASVVTWIYSMADSLWPLGDRNNQALHDKAARTIVVRR